MADPLRPTDPRQIGRYRLLRRLGQGGMGSVFLASAPDGRLVAVKVIRAEYAHEEQFRARFRSEVTRAKQVPPFCTAEVLDADPDHETPYLVVEYVDGPSLNEVVAENGPLTGGSLHGVAVGVGAALAAIHGAGVIHRDLKPRNVLFALGTPKVIDFGIARPLEPTSFHTRAEEVVGTLAYMAPERLDPETDRLLSPAADVFAWGAVVTFAGTGRTPFGGDSPAVTAARILTQPPRIGDLPAYLAELVTAALEKEPENRPTAPELLDRLLVSGAPSTPALPPDLRRDAEAAQHSGHFHTGDQRRRKRSARRRRLTVALAGVTAGAVAIAAAAAGTVLRDPLSDAPPPAPGASAVAPVVSGPAIFDALRQDTQFGAAKSDSGTCAYDEGLRVTARAGQVMACEAYDRNVFPAAQNISVRARLNTDRSCAGIWFRAAADEPDDSFEDGYRVTVCPDEVSLAAILDGDATVISATRRATTTGSAHRVQLVADEREATVAIDGAPVLRGLLSETTMISGRVMLGSVSRGDVRSAVTFTDAELRSGTDPAVPATPAFLTGDAQFTAGMHLNYDIGKVSIVEPTEFLTGAEYCARNGLPEDTPQCAQKYVPVPSGVKVTLPMTGDPAYLDYRGSAQCLDPQTRVGTCRVSFRKFSTSVTEPSPWPALVTVRGGKLVTVARMNLF